MTDVDPEVTVELASPDDCFFLDVWNKSCETSVLRMNEALARLVTLSTAMAGGSIALLKEDVCYGWWRIVAACLFFLALASAAVGAVPFSSSVRFNPNAVRMKYIIAARVKKRWVNLSLTWLVCGILAAIVGVIKAYSMK